MKIIVLLHGIATIAASLLMLASFVLGILAGVQRWRLKRKDIRVLSGNLPPMVKMESGYLLLLRWGFIFLTAGLVTGMGLLLMVDRTLLLTFHIFSALVAWLIYIYVLVSSRFSHWMGRRMVGLSLIGFFILITIFIQVHVR